MGELLRFILIGSVAEDFLQCHFHPRLVQFLKPLFTLLLFINLQSNINQTRFIVILYSQQQWHCRNYVFPKRCGKWFVYINICKSIDPNKFQQKRSNIRLFDQTVFTTGFAVYVDNGTLRNKHVRQRHCHRIRSRARKVVGMCFSFCLFFAVTVNYFISFVSQHFALFFNLSSTCKYLLRKQTRKCTYRINVQSTTEGSSL